MASTTLDANNDPDVIVLSDDDSDTRIILSPKQATDTVSLKRKRPNNTSNENADSTMNSSGSQEAKNFKKEECDSVSVKKQPLLTMNANGRKASGSLTNSKNVLKLNEDSNGVDGTETCGEKIFKKMNFDAEGWLFY